VPSRARRSEVGDAFDPVVAARMAANARRAYGALVSEVLGAANTGKNLGRDFGADLTEAELRYLVRREWAVSAADIL
jgi:glycerol-3-phosphate dehydrogenase